MTYTYLIIYLYRCCSREGEFTGSFFYYTDKKISDCELADVKKTIKEISDLARAEGKREFMVDHVVIAGIKLLE